MPPLLFYTQTNKAAVLDSFLPLVARHTRVVTTARGHKTRTRTNWVALAEDANEGYTPQYYSKRWAQLRRHSPELLRGNEGDRVFLLHGGRIAARKLKTHKRPTPHVQPDVLPSPEEGERLEEESSNAGSTDGVELWWDGVVPDWNTAGVPDDQLLPPRDADHPRPCIRDDYAWGCAGGSRDTPYSDSSSADDETGLHLSLLPEELVEPLF